MSRVLCAVLLLVAGSAAADVDPAFARLRDSAEPIEGLAGFLDKYVGECSNVFAGKSCAEKARAFRANANARKFYMIVTEESARMLSFGALDPGRGELTINLTPFFSGGGYALTEGAPKRTDANGNPILPLIAVPGKTTEELNHATLTRLLETRQLRLQVVFSPEGSWSLPRKGGGKLMGVKAKLLGVLISHGRTGIPIALWLRK